MREVKVSPWETIGGLLIREGYKDGADAAALQTVTNLLSPKHHKNGALRLHVRYIRHHRNTSGLGHHHLYAQRKEAQR